MAVGKGHVKDGRTVPSSGASGFSLALIQAIIDESAGVADHLQPTTQIMNPLKRLWMNARQRVRVLRCSWSVTRERVRARKLISKARLAPGLNLWRHDDRNVGDAYCGPQLYFAFLSDVVPLDIRFYGAHAKCFPLRSKVVILGGGGVFVWRDEVNRLVNDPEGTLICWGAGHNAHGSDRVESMEILKRFTLVGIRDFNHGFEWVPCVSCMSSLFNESYPIEHDVVLYEHYQFKVPRPDPGIARMANDSMDLQKVIAFLGSGELILTSSYHGAYWATLLGRKVIIINPFSSKFFGMKHKHIMCSFNQWEGLRSSARSYSEALTECRGANVAFAEKVAQVIKARASSRR